MLLNGVNHAAARTNDTNRLHAFYRKVFDAAEAQLQTPLFGRGASTLDAQPGVFNPSGTRVSQFAG